VSSSPKMTGQFMTGHHDSWHLNVLPFAGTQNHQP